MTRWARARVDTFRRSLFYVPALYVVASVVLAFATLGVDAAITRRDLVLPRLLDATVESARALLGTVAAATITFAAIAFSVALLMIQQAGSQFSSRVLQAFFRDPVTKRSVGIALGTFTYCLFVLRAVRRPLEDGGEAVVPYVSVFLASVLGVVAVVAIIAFIHHSAHSMEAAEVIHRVTEEGKRQIRRLCPDAAGSGAKGNLLGPQPDGSNLVVRATSDGWVQGIEATDLLRVVPAGGVVTLDAGAGTFVADGSSLCRIWPEPDDPEEAAAVVTRAVRLGRTRTMDQDMALGVRQLVDIALRALSPGVNDPTTAEESIVHIGALLRELFLRDLPPRVLSDDEERRLFRPHDLTHRDYVALAFDQIRRAGASDPSVAATMLDTIGKVVDELDDRYLEERAAILRQQAELVLDECRSASPHPEDLAMVTRVAERWGLAVPPVTSAAGG